jgi:hypothetical protein
MRSAGTQRADPGVAHEATVVEVEHIPRPARGYFFNACYMPHHEAFDESSCVARGAASALRERRAGRATGCAGLLQHQHDIDCIDSVEFLPTSSEQLTRLAVQPPFGGCGKAAVPETLPASTLFAAKAPDWSRRQQGMPNIACNSLSTTESVQAVRIDPSPPAPISQCTPTPARSTLRGPKRLTAYAAARTTHGEDCRRLGTFGNRSNPSGVGGFLETVGRILDGTKCTGPDALAGNERFFEVDLSAEFPPERREAQIDPHAHESSEPQYGYGIGRLPSAVHL